MIQCPMSSSAREGGGMAAISNITPLHGRINKISRVLYIVIVQKLKMNNDYIIIKL